MTAYKIIASGPISATSFLSTSDPTAEGNIRTAIGAVTGAGNSLTVDDGAFLHNATATTLYTSSSSSAWTFNINGQLISDDDDALSIGGTSSVIGPQTKINIGTEGSLSNKHTSLSFATIYSAQAVAIVNKGNITNSLGATIYTYNVGSSSLNNSGTITAASTYDAVNAHYASAFTLTNTGTIYGNITLGDNSKITSSGDIYGYIHLGNGTNTISATGDIGGEVSAGSGNDTLTVGAGKNVNGNVNLGNGNNTISSLGGLYGTVTTGGGNDKLTVGADGYTYLVNLGEGTNIVNNSGTIHNNDSTHVAYQGSTGGNDTVTNNKGGTIYGGIEVGNGVNSLTNAGEVNYSAVSNLSYSGGNDSDTIKNTGKMDGGITAGNGTNSLTNSGTIHYDASLYSYTGGASNDTITNSGLMDGYVNLGDGTNKVTNSGTINAIVYGGASTDTVTNSGTIYGVSLGDGSDSFTNTGHVSNTIDLGTGSDHFTGGKFGVSVLDNSGQDTYTFGSGDDTYYAFGGTGTVTGDGADVVNGGGGTNLYYAYSSAYTGFERINLDSQHHAGAYAFATSTYDTAANTAILDEANGNVDKVTNFHKAYLGKGGGLLIGSSTADDLSAFQATTYSAELDGLGGNDSLHGSGAGTNYLVGGAGADQLFSGGNTNQATYFIYNAASESGLTTATRDVISNFQAGSHDFIRLNFDANTTTAEFDYNFNFIGTDQAFTGVAGQLHVITTAIGERIEGDITGDGKADFSIDVVDASHALNFALVLGEYLYA